MSRATDTTAPQDALLRELPGLDYRALFEAGPVPRLVLTPDLRIAAVTESYLRATMTKRHEMIGRGVFEVFPDNPDDPEATGVGKLRESLEEVLRTRREHVMALQRYDVQRPASEGGGFELRYWKPVNSPVLDGRGEVAFLIHRVEDVTAEVRFRQEEEEARRREGRYAAELKAMNQELEAFSYSVSHDLRAPLRHITGFAALVSQSAEAAALGPATRRHLTIILDAANRMGRLIDDLLAFSRTSRADLIKTEVDMNLLVDDAREEMTVDAAGREVAWRIGRLPITYGDPAMLRLVMVNLLSNALKYSSTRPRAEIEVGTIPGMGSEVVVFVRDNGVGFDMKYAGQLFGVFQRLHNDEAFEGTGIGLANVRRIVTRHGGSTWAESEVDKGATFYFSLPGAGDVPDNVGSPRPLGTGAFGG